MQGKQIFDFPLVLFLMAFFGVGLLGLLNIKSWVKPCFTASHKTPTRDANKEGHQGNEKSLGHPGVEGWEQKVYSRETDGVKRWFGPEHKC